MKRCFPHVINLACQAVLEAITNMDFANEDAEDYLPTEEEHNPIAMIQTIVHVVNLFNISSFNVAYFFNFEDSGIVAVL